MTRTRNQGVFNADVCLLAISDDSSWLATVESRPFYHKYVVNYVLKFWTYNEKSQIFLKFGKNASIWMIVAASSTRLLVWNVLSETLLTTIWVQAERLIADFTPNNDLFVFTPNNKNLVYKKENIFGNNDKSTSILWAIFASKSDHQNGQI